MGYEDLFKKTEKEQLREEIMELKKEIERLKAEKQVLSNYKYMYEQARN